MTFTPCCNGGSKIQNATFWFVTVKGGEDKYMNRVNKKLPKTRRAAATKHWNNELRQLQKTA